MIDPAHKARIDAAVARAFDRGIYVHIPQTEAAYAMCEVDEEGHLHITSRLLEVTEQTIHPGDN